MGEAAFAGWSFRGHLWFLRILLSLRAPLSLRTPGSRSALQIRCDHFSVLYLLSPIAPGGPLFYDVPKVAERYTLVLRLLTLWNTLEIRFYLGKTPHRLPRIHGALTGHQPSSFSIVSTRLSQVCWLAHSTLALALLLVALDSLTASVTHSANCVLP